MVGNENAAILRRTPRFVRFLTRQAVWLAVTWGLIATPTRAADRWPDERQAGTCAVHADFSLVSHAYLLDEIGGLHLELSQILGIPEANEPIHVFLFRHKSTYQTYLKQFFPDVPYRRALFIKRRGPGMVFAYVNRELAIDVRHETTHALLHASLSHVPLWLDEGLAEYFEVAPDERPFGNPHLNALRRELFRGRVSGIQSLEELADVEQMGPAQYRDAWSWVHFMLHGPPEAHDELVRFLMDIQDGVPAGRLSDRLRRRLPDLEGSFVAHFKTWRR